MSVGTNSNTRFVGCCHPAGPTDPKYNGFLLTRRQMEKHCRSLVGKPVLEAHQTGDPIGFIDSVWINDLDELIVGGYIHSNKKRVAQDLRNGLLGSLSLGMNHTILEAADGKPLYVVSSNITEVSLCPKGDLQCTEILTIASKYHLNPERLTTTQAEAMLQSQRTTSYFEGRPYLTHAGTIPTFGHARIMNQTVAATAAAAVPKESTPPQQQQHQTAAATPSEPKRQKVAEGTPAAPAAASKQQRANPETATTPITLDKTRYATLLEQENQLKEKVEIEKKLQDELDRLRKETAEWKEASNSKDPNALKRKREIDREREVNKTIHEKFIPAQSTLKRLAESPLPEDMKKNVVDLLQFLDNGIKNPTIFKPEGVLEEATRWANVTTAASMASNKRVTDLEAQLNAARSGMEKQQKERQSLEQMYSDLKQKSELVSRSSPAAKASGIWSGVPKMSITSQQPQQWTPTVQRQQQQAPPPPQPTATPTPMMDTSNIPSWVRAVRPLSIQRTQEQHHMFQELRRTTPIGINKASITLIDPSKFGPDVPAIGSVNPAFSGLF